MNRESRKCQNCQSEFWIEPDDFGFYEKMGVPAPNLCPDCRFKRRAAFRNEQTLYKRTCDLCKKSIITMYNPRAPYVVYCNDCWDSDKWDPFSYAQDYDPAKTFFEQLGELIRKVPKAATYSSPTEGPNINSEYSNFAGGNKDCYLVFNSGPANENCAYSRGVKGRDIFDTYFGDDLERIYEGENIHKSAGVAWGWNITDCLDSYLLLNCVGCQNCFGCVNLRHKSYYFFNEPLSKDEWKRRVFEILGSYKKMEEARRRFEEFSLRFPFKEHNNFKSNNCVGNYIFNSENCYKCFEASYCEDTSYSFSVKSSKDCYDLIGHGRKAELMLEGVGIGSGARVLASWWVQLSHDIEYSFAVRSSEYCIGCDSVKNAKYTILNRRYSEAEYKKLRGTIIEELKRDGAYGLFFPPQLAFFAWNETIGQENFLLTKDQAIAQGFRWEDDIPRTKDKETLASEQIPDDIKDVTDSILNEILKCISCGYNYRLIPAEMELYRKLLIPVPRQCFNCRHLNRIRRRGPFKLYARKCAKCNKSIQTSYAPNRPEFVYCEQCYNSEVV